MENLNKGENVKQINLLYLIGFYTLMLDSFKFEPSWRRSYEERLEELKRELDA